MEQIHTDIKMYYLLFQDYPDVVNIDELCRMLGGIGRKSAYALLREHKIRAMKVGRAYRIPKLHVIQYLGLADAENIMDQ